MSDRAKIPSSVGLAVQGEDANGIELKDPAYVEKENCRKVVLNACGSG